LFADGRLPVRLSASSKPINVSIVAAFFQHDGLLISVTSD
jgi:hypothetical protein